MKVAPRGGILTQQLSTFAKFAIAGRIEDMRDLIIREIQRLARENGSAPPGMALFRKSTGITSTKWRGVFWLKWSEALNEAGFQPNSWNQKSDSDYLLKAIGRLCRKLGRFPTRTEIRMERRLDANFPAHSTIENHFPTNEKMIAALHKLAEHDASWENLPSLLPVEHSISNTSQSKVEDGFVYLLKSGYHFKIGRSGNIERRLREVTVSLPEAVTLVHSIRTDDSSGIEAYWHRRFADRRANGEWFKLTASDVRAFCRRSFQ